MKKEGIEDFLKMLVVFGHDGDQMCLDTIEECLASGVVSTVSHYEKYLKENVEVKNLKPPEINTLLKKGFLIWTIEGTIYPLKGNKLPLLNGKIIMANDMKEFLKQPVVLFKIPQEE